MSSNIEIEPLKNWLSLDGKPLVIAGPCSAESERQVMETAKALLDVPYVKYFRAGIWKPRTRPGSFEGVGSEGFKWLKRVKEETGLKTTIEVANPQHVEEACNNDMDMLWIGARTVVNPFMVQEIATALNGCDVPVMVKNPVTPDLKLWLGAIERIEHTGIKKIIAIHRGFHYFENSPYRNAPMWEIPIELKRLLPSLPVIVDPSHICGNRDLLAEISQKALDLEMDGLMIETHINPAEAKTDAAQQITPEALKSLIKNLIIRERTGTIDFENKLEELRTEIDKLDGELLQILAKRMEIIDAIGEYKSKNQITILQMKRWAGIIRDRLSIGTNMGLDEQFLMQLLHLIHKESIKRQTDILTGKKNK